MRLGDQAAAEEVVDSPSSPYIFFRTPCRQSSPTGVVQGLRGTGTAEVASATRRPKPFYFETSKPLCHCQVSMCKMCNTKAQKTLEILTNVRNWPQENWHCTPCNPCDHIKQLSKRARARHAERLEYSSATASAEYETEFCEALGKAILQHHGVRIWTESEIQRAERASKRRKRHPEAPETAT